MRQVCAVDHVEIFPKSTSGWVRVKGFEHFRAAFGTVTPLSFVRDDMHDLVTLTASDNRGLQSYSMAKSSRAAPS